MFSGLTALIFVLSIPSMIGFACVRLFTTRKGTGGESFAWSNRWYSALKRLCWAWVIELLILVVFGLLVSFVNLNFIPDVDVFAVLIVLAAVAAISGFLKPRRYFDNVERIRSGRRLAVGLLAFYLFFPLVGVYLVVNILAGTGIGIGNERREVVINTDSYSWWQFRVTGSLGKRMVPPRATDIQFTLKPGLGLVLGAGAEMRCRVSQEDLQAFAKDQGYVFQNEDIKRNGNLNGAPDCDWIHDIWRKYNPNQPYPKDFLAYNYRYKSCGGFSFLYDVKTGYLYGDWASN